MIKKFYLEYDDETNFLQMNHEAGTALNSIKKCIVGHELLESFNKLDIKIRSEIDKLKRKEYTGALFTPVMIIQLLEDLYK